MQALIIICEQTRMYAPENHAHAILLKRSVTWPHDHSELALPSISIILSGGGFIPRIVRNR